MRTILTTLLALALFTGAANAAPIRIASWDVWQDNLVSGGLVADFTETGVTASIEQIPPIYMLRRVLNGAGNTDGTFGPTLTGADTTDADSRAMQTMKPQDIQEGDFAVYINNTTGGSITLDELLFDFEVKTNAHNTYSVVFENITQNNTTDVLGSATLSAGWQDVAVDASSVTLADNDEGRFIVTVSKDVAVGNGSNSWDNIAITGTLIIPEPASLAMFGLGLIGVLRRRKH